MSQTVEFETDCPNNHNQTIKLSRDEFEAALQSGGLVFHCNTCDIDWPPNAEEMEKLRKAFAAEAA
jgi:hypothetical protein